MRWVYGGGLAIILITFLADIVGLHVDYRLAANWSLTCFAGFVTVFTIRYAGWSNWRANRIGTALLAKSVLMTTMLWQIVLSVWWDAEYPHRQQIRFIIYALGALSYLVMVIMLWREQKRDRLSTDV